MLMRLRHDNILFGCQILMCGEHVHVTMSSYMLNCKLHRSDLRNSTSVQKALGKLKHVVLVRLVYA